RACKRLRRNTHLVNVNNKEKEEVLKTFAQNKNSYLANAPRISYHIGLHYDNDAGKYKWEGTEKDISYSKWDIGYPDLSKGECVRADVDENFDSRWQNEQCSGAGARSMCQTIACDTNNYCE
ncbi:lectin C-type domain protein, partial [Oesophagostomum dentatum]